MVRKKHSQWMQGLLEAEELSQRNMTIRLIIQDNGMPYPYVLTGYSRKCNHTIKFMSNYSEWAQGVQDYISHAEHLKKIGINKK